MGSPYKWGIGSLGTTRHTVQMFPYVVIYVLASVCLVVTNKLILTEFDYNRILFESTLEEHAES